MFERGFFYNKLFPHIWYTWALCCKPRLPTCRPAGSRPAFQTLNAPPPPPPPPPFRLPPHPAMPLPQPGLTSPRRHAGASSSAPDYSLANSSAEKTSSCYETRRGTTWDLEKTYRVMRLATGWVWRGVDRACDHLMTLCFNLRHQRGLEDIIRAALWCGNVRCPDVGSSCENVWQI